MGLMFLFSVNVSAQAESICEVDVSPYKVDLSGRTYSEQGAYPALFYNNVIYIPMTYDVGEAVGRVVEWVDGYEQDVLLLTEKERVREIKEKKAIERVIENKSVIASVLNSAIAVCKGKYIDLIHGTEEYPLLMHKDIVYIPLTWENIVSKFGWEYSFDEANGVCIATSQSNVPDRSEKDIYISEDGSTTSYILERSKYIQKHTDDYAEEKTDYIGLIRFNYDMVGKDLVCYNMSEFIIEKELALPVKKGDVRIFKSYNNSGEFYSPVREDLWKFLHAATTSMLDTRTGCINKWQSLPSWRQDVNTDNELGIASIRMTGTDYVSDGVIIVNSEDSDIVLKSIPMQYVIKRVDEGRNEIILTYDVPQFPGGSIVVPAPTSTITKLQFSLPPWDFRDANGIYVPEGEYEISLVVPEAVEYIVSGDTKVLGNPKGVFINSRIKLVK